jgi:hypothetical protein
MVSAITQVQTGLRPYQGAPGFRFLKDLYPTHRSGGLNYYPYCSIQSGLTPSWSLAAGAPVAVPANLTVAIAPGNAILDSQPATLSTSVNLVFTPEDVADGYNYFRVFLNPTRILQPVVASGGVYTPPTTLLNGDAVQDGDKYLEAIDFPDHLEGRAFYVREGGVWKNYDPSFATPDVPVQQGRNRVYGNGTRPKVALSNFTINAVEVPIYLATGYPIFGYQPARANLRNPASLEIVTAEVYYHVLPKVVTGTFINGDADVTVAYAERDSIADLMSSVTNTNVLALDGETLDTGAYNSATGVITLGAPYTGTSGTKEVLLTPVTPANVYVLSPGKSNLVASTNFTNP